MHFEEVIVKRDFNTWLQEFRPSIATYQYYVNFEKVHANVQALRIPLHILNSLVGSKHIREDFHKLVNQYPETLECIPILIAKREKEIYCRDDRGDILYHFARSAATQAKNTPEQYAYFMEKTGLFDLLQNRIVSSLFDYVTGIETGLDSNGRKNRGGHLMEDLVESFIVQGGFIKGKTYFKEMYLHEISSAWGLNMGAISNEGHSEKRFDFVVKTDKSVYGIETNFYAGGGSKLNETARSYKQLAYEADMIDGFTFVWVTDGKGWKDAKHNLEETFDVMTHIYNIHDLENNVVKKVFV